MFPADNALTHEAIDFLHRLVLPEPLDLLCHDFAVVPRRGAGLCVAGSEVVNLSGGLVNQRRQPSGVGICLLHELKREIIAVIHEVASEDGSKMQFLSSL